MTFMADEIAEAGTSVARAAAREGLLDTLARLRQMGADVVRVDAGGDDAPDRLAASTLSHPKRRPSP